MQKIQRAVISCYDKSGVVELGKALRDYGVELICTEGTQKALGKGGVESTEIAEFTGVREMMSGRVKTIHPKVHAGLLGIRDNKVHVEDMQMYECQWIDMVVVNVHPIEDLIRRPAITPDEVVEQVDIGGVAMIRSAAKNFRYVTVVVNPARYTTLIHELRAHEGAVPFMSRYRLAQEAFACTAQYDAALSTYLPDCERPEE